MEEYRVVYSLSLSSEYSILSEPEHNLYGHVRVEWHNISS